jgi:hypothetical protein
VLGPIVVVLIFGIAVTVARLLMLPAMQRRGLLTLEPRLLRRWWIAMAVAFVYFAAVVWSGTNGYVAIMLALGAAPMVIGLAAQVVMLRLAQRRAR